MTKIRRKEKKREMTEEDKADEDRVVDEDVSEGKI